MKRAFKTVGLFGKYQDANVGEALLRLGRFLEARGLSVRLDEKTAQVLAQPVARALPLDRIGHEINLAIVIGGDGTLLHTARHLAPYDIPIIGVNQGRLGFLTDIPVADMEQEVGRILDGDCQPESRLMLQAEINRHGKVVHSGRALNDIIISKGELARLIEYETYIGGKFVNSARGDGIIVASPTGSTAYAMSAGGPILQPALPAFVLVPICPHTLSNRPIVVPSTSAIEISVLSLNATPAHVAFDGQLDFALQEGDRIHVRQSEHHVELLHPSRRNHYDVLREKLHWGTKY